MNVATHHIEVGVRDLKNNLSRYLERVRDGEEILVTDHGKPVARVLRVDAATDRLAELVDAGLVTPPKSKRRRVPTPIKAVGTVSDLVAEQRR